MAPVKVLKDPSLMTDGKVKLYFGNIRMKTRFGYQLAISVMTRYL